MTTSAEQYNPDDYSLEEDVDNVNPVEAASLIRVGEVYTETKLYPLNYFDQLSKLKKEQYRLGNRITKLCIRLTELYPERRYINETMLNVTKSGHIALIAMVIRQEDDWGTPVKGPYDDDEL
jgi:hypothetical protein